MSDVAVPFSIDTPSGIVRGEALVPDVARGTVMCCHGFKGFAHWGFFPLLATRLAESGFVAITFDGSGNGVGPDRESFSDADGFFANTYAREQQDVAAVVEHAGARGWLPHDGRYALVGHSRGGATALLRAVEAGNRVWALATWAAIADVRRWTDDQRREWRTRGWLDVVNARTGEVLRLGTAQLNEIEAHAEGWLDLAAAARRLTIPWLIAHGLEDETVSVGDAHRLGAAAPSAALHLVAGAGHTFGASHPLGDPPPPLQDVLARTLVFFGNHAP